MKITILLASLVIGALLVQDSEAWRFGGGRFGGWGGRFGGWGGRFGGWGGRFGGLGGRFGGWGGRFGGWGGLGGWGLGYGAWARPWGLYSPWYSLGYRYFRDTMSHGQIEHRVACNFIPDKSLLICQREDVGVECEIVANLTTITPIKNYELFGIGHACTKGEKISVDQTRFNLYPRVLDNSAWLNHTTVVGGKSVSLNLFHSVSHIPHYYGFRVIESTCFDQLVELFRSVPVTSYENVTIVNENGIHRNVSLFGEVLTKKIDV